MFYGCLFFQKLHIETYYICAASLAGVQPRDVSVRLQDMQVFSLYVPWLGYGSPLICFERCCVSFTVRNISKQVWLYEIMATVALEH